MRVFMLGWEFPPYISGGLGTACYGLTKGLNEANVDVCFVLPTAVPLGSNEADQSHVDLRSPTDLLKSFSPKEVDQAHLDKPHHIKSPVDYEDIFNHLEVHQLPAVLTPYANPEAIPENFEQNSKVLRQHARHEAQKAALKRALKATMQEVAELSAEPKPHALPKEAQKNNGSIIHGTSGVHYEGDLYSQVHNFASLALELSTHEEFDVVHAHDWMTFPAGMAVAKSTGKPLVIHVHSTEFDRSGQHVNQLIYDFERAGMEAADMIICVSHLTANIVEHRYGISRDKISVIYNAVELPDHEASTFKPIARNEKIVLFLGRVTMQKGPEYFLEAAKRVVEKYKKVRFVMAGSGDMIRHCIDLAADLNIGKYVTFTGFLRGDDVTRIFKMADLYVMPSVSEPFGIAPLEAISHEVPVLISKQSGVSEILTHVLKVDFWDTDEMANKILAVLRHKPLQSTLKEHGKIELKHISWADSALKVKKLYAKLMGHKQEA